MSFIGSPRYCRAHSQYLQLKQKCCAAYPKIFEPPRQGAPDTEFNQPQCALPAGAAPPSRGKTHAPLFVTYAISDRKIQLFVI